VSDVVVGPVALLVCGWARISNMTGPADRVPASVVTVRYWAAARASAGVDVDEVEVTGEVTLDTVLAEARRRHDDQRFRDVMSTCSVLVGERPVGGRDPAAVVVHPGETVELLPPFAGG
jgi:molybdopterin converting factor small subunit